MRQPEETRFVAGAVPTERTVFEFWEEEPRGDTSYVPVKAGYQSTCLRFARLLFGSLGAYLSTGRRSISSSRLHQPKGERKRKLLIQNTLAEIIS